MDREPETLQEAVIYFSNRANCHEYVFKRRWPDGVTCPTCGSTKVTFSEKYNRWQCGSHHAKRQFTIKTGTIFEDSPLGLDKWLVAMWLIANCKNGISSYEIMRALGVTQKTAWFMDHRIRMAVHAGSFEKLIGEVEVDETYIGGKARNMHASARGRRITGTGPKDKTAVMGLLQRGGKVRTVVVPSRKKPIVQAEVKKHVKAGAALYSDALRSYDGLSNEYAHQVIDHAIAYVNGKIHTNCLENFRSLLKRGIKGTYVSLEPFHLFRYLDEQAFRYNNREVTDADRFGMALTGVLCKRITYKKLTAKQA